MSAFFRALWGEVRAFFWGLWVFVFTSFMLLTWAIAIWFWAFLLLGCSDTPTAPREDAPADSLPPVVYVGFERGIVPLPTRVGHDQYTFCFDKPTVVFRRGVEVRNYRVELGDTVCAFNTCTVVTSRWDETEEPRCAGGGGR